MNRIHLAGLLPYEIFIIDEVFLLREEFGYYLTLLPAEVIKGRFNKSVHEEE